MNKYLSAVVLGAFLTQSALANGSRSSYLPPPPDSSTEDFYLNPDSLQERLLDQNIDIMLIANRVHTAKTQVNMARSRLFPSLGLGALLLSGGDPTFLISSVEILLPFLLPSRWFDAAESQEILNADLEAYKAFELNAYASAFGLATSLAVDKELLDIFRGDLATWREIESLAEARRRWGLISESDLAVIKGQRAIAELRSTRIESAYAQSLAQLRRTLGLNIHRKLVIQDLPVSEVPETALPFDTLLDRALSEAPESRQIAFLIQAAEMRKLSRAFGFFSSASLASFGAPGENASLAFSNMSGRGFLDIGIDRLPLIDLSYRELENLRLRQTELRLEMARLLESSLRLLEISNRSFAAALDAETQIRGNFDRLFARYRAGAGVTLRDILEARLGIQEASLERVRAEAELNLQRLSLQRILRTETFGKINGCTHPNVAPVRSGKGSPDARPPCQKKAQT